MGDFKVKKGAKTEIITSFMTFYDEVAAYLMTDTETKNLVEEALTPDCYPDPYLRTLTIDVGFYISRFCSEGIPSSFEESFG